MAALPSPRSIFLAVIVYTSIALMHGSPASSETDKCPVSSLFYSGLVVASDALSYRPPDQRIVSGRCTIDVSMDPSTIDAIILNGVKSILQEEFFATNLNAYEPMSLIYAADIFLRRNEREKAIDLIVQAAKYGEPNAIRSLLILQDAKNFPEAKKADISIVEFTYSISKFHTCIPISEIAFMMKNIDERIKGLAKNSYKKFCSR